MLASRLDEQHSTPPTGTIISSQLAGGRTVGARHGHCAEGDAQRVDSPSSGAGSAAGLTSGAFVCVCLCVWPYYVYLCYVRVCHRKHMFNFLFVMTEINYA